MLHTVFNVITTLILVWFCPQIAKLVSAIIKMPKSTEEQEVFRLKYIEEVLSLLLNSIKQALKEVVNFGRISQKGLDYALKAVNSKTGDEFDTYRNKLVKYEEISDRIEREIATYLHKIPTADISTDTRSKFALSTGSAANLKVWVTAVRESGTLLSVAIFITRDSTKKSSRISTICLRRLTMHTMS